MNQFGFPNPGQRAAQQAQQQLQQQMRQTQQRMQQQAQDAQRSMQEQMQRQRQQMQQMQKEQRDRQMAGYWWMKQKERKRREAELKRQSLLKAPQAPGLPGSSYRGSTHNPQPLVSDRQAHFGGSDEGSGCARAFGVFFTLLVLAAVAFVVVQLLH